MQAFCHNERRWIRRRFEAERIFWEKFNQLVALSHTSARAGSGDWGALRAFSAAFSLGYGYSSAVLVTIVRFWLQ